MDAKLKQVVEEAIKIHCEIDHRPADAERLDTKLKNMEMKIDQLLEVYTAASLVKKFIIGFVGFIGVLTGLIYSWVKLFKEIR